MLRQLTIAATRMEQAMMKQLMVNWEQVFKKGHALDQQEKIIAILYAFHEEFPAIVTTDIFNRARLEKPTADGRRLLGQHLQEEPQNSLCKC